MKVHIVTSRPKPRMGDRRTTKKYGAQVRIPAVCDFPPFRGMWIVNNGRQVYEWASLARVAAGRFAHLLTAEERAALPTQGKD